MMTVILLSKTQHISLGMQANHEEKEYNCIKNIFSEFFRVKNKYFYDVQ